MESYLLASEKVRITRMHMRVCVCVSVWCVCVGVCVCVCVCGLLTGEERQAEIAMQESSSIPLLFSPDGAFHSVWGD